MKTIPITDFSAPALPPATPHLATRECVAVFILDAVKFNAALVDNDRSLLSTASQVNERITRGIA